jgi:hypothetical protein
MQKKKKIGPKGNGEPSGGQGYNLRTVVPPKSKRYTIKEGIPPDRQKKKTTKKI